MPVFEYSCKSCGYEFEELVGKTEDDSKFTCKLCGNKVERKMSSFSSVIAGGSSTEPVDMTIGREAEKRWQMHFDKQTERRGDKPLDNVPLPKTEDGKFMPVMGLGNKDEKEKRQEYSSALQEHRQERTKKGQAQFSEAGPF
jgi:putative FmdB family regulatory protein